MLNKLEITNFRSYQTFAVDFDRVTVFIGENGVGKTNILEAVSYLTLARSFRTRVDKEVVHWGSDVARIVGQTDESIVEVALNLQTKGGKLIRVDGVNKRAIELLGHLSVILFLPESLQLVDGPPQLRRQFLDLLLIQRDLRYAYHLLQLQKILRQRNRLLRFIEEGKATLEQLDFWDDSFVEAAGIIVSLRVRLLQAINQTIAHHYKTISGKAGKLSLAYKAASVSESGGEAQKFSVPEECPVEPDFWREELRETLVRYRGREVAASASLYGPQRDDIVFILDGRPLAAFGSRGEFRSAILALKTAEADFLLAVAEEEESVPLVFLLDDVYSELDEHRRGQLASLISNHQAIITTTDLSHLDVAIKKKAKIVTLLHSP